MNTLANLITLASLAAVIGAFFIVFGALLAWLQWRRLGWSLHAIGALGLAASAFVAAALQAAFRAPREMLVLDYVAGVVFIAWSVLAARVAYRSGDLSRAVQPRDQRARSIRRHTTPT